MADDHSAPTSGQEPTASAASKQAGNGYRSQADDAVNDERPGADGERLSPRGSDERSAARGQAPTSTSDDEGLSEADLRRALKAARAEAAENRKAKRDLDDLHRQAEESKLSETEKLQKALAEAQSEREKAVLHAQERVTRAEVRAVARDLGIKPELALRLIDLAAIEFDDAGDPTNIDALLQQAMTEFGLSPTATRTSSAHPSAANAAHQPTSRAGATNPPRSGQIAGANGVFAANEQPRVTDDRLWKR